MSKQKKIEGSVDAWENRELGAEEQFVAIANDINEEALDDSLGLQMISIRIQKSLLEDLRQLAKIHGLGYQPLMKQILQRFVECEKKRLLNQASAEAEQARKAEEAGKNTKKAVA
ncbi:hypothetical protein AAIA72_11375 [Hahella sp. SMD15-11]|uniref:BrnA antitoxin family protein n=1 Tax=Thermohahella caldifontis TaxID=3142973 RepID=A0AB39UTV0_9GAMM